MVGNKKEEESTFYDLFSLEISWSPARMDWQHFQKSQACPRIQTLLTWTECHRSTACATTTAYPLQSTVVLRVCAISQKADRHIFQYIQTLKDLFKVSQFISYKPLLQWSTIWHHRAGKLFFRKLENLPKARINFVKMLSQKRILL